ncbi:MAG: DUF2130 domain-containing protein [Planctomycetales bacterium]|nr:DUF2130 domain-containing protein [Planctomycetales bacterium]
MLEPTIICPHCKTEIKLTESLAAPIVDATRARYEKQIADKDAELRKERDAVKAESERLERARADFDNQVAEQVKAGRATIAAEENKKARLALGADLDAKDKQNAELLGIIEERNAKLVEAQQAEADALRKQREFDDAKRELEVTIEKRVQETLEQARVQAVKGADEQSRLKLAEKEKTITDLQTRLADALRKAEQGSQQMQGEVQELELETLLRTRFPRDTVEPVPKGEHGGDVLHRVLGLLGQPCGTILWESKRTKNWSDGWLPKLREDQRVAKAEIAVVVTQTLPKGVDTFDLIDGVWVTESRSAVPVALALRQTLIEVGVARQAGEGQQTKMEMVYQYMTGPRFRHRVQAIAEAFAAMREDLDKERKVITKQWAKRETQIEMVMQATVGMYGDLQGIAGKSLQEIEGLDVKLLGDGSEVGAT